MMLVAFYLTVLSRLFTGATSSPFPGDAAPRRPFYIGGVFPKFNDPAYDLLPATVQTAIDHVNNMTGLLDGYELRLRWEWTNGGAARALQLLNTFVYTEPHVVMTWGPALSSEALVLNEVAAQYNLVQVGLANSPALGQGHKYPLTLRIWEEENEVNPARVALMKRLNWSRCGMIFEESTFRQHFEDLAELLRQSNITVAAMEVVHDVTQSQEQIRSLQRHDVRVIFIGFYAGAAKRLFCQIYHLGLWGPKYVWIVPGWYPAGWWLTVTRENHGCTAEQLDEMLIYHLFVSGVQVIDKLDDIDYHGLKPQDDPTQRQYLKWLRMKSLLDNNWATLGYAYDALFVIALTFNASIADLAEMTPPRRLDDDVYEDEEISKIFRRNAETIDVYGVTDHLVISQDGARVFTEYVYIEQSQENGSYAKVARFNTANSTVSLLDGRTLLWSGKGPPVDGITEIEEPITISLVNRLVSYVLSAFGSLLSLYFVTINIRYRNQRAIKLSSPMLNNFIVCGCLLLYAAVFLFGLDRSTMNDDVIVGLCFVETALICVGISLAFGALFLKTYRIHLIWTNSMKHAKRMEIPDSKLMAGVAAMVIVDVICILLWILLDRTTVQKFYLESKLDETNPELELYIVPVYRECLSDNQIVFTMAIYSVKGLVMLGGIFLAWEMRRITVAELNDSHFIALSVYVVALTMAITIPTLYVIKENRELYFGVRSVAIVLANTTVLCLVFVPKITLFFKTKDGELKLHFGNKDQSTGSNLPAASTLNHGPGQGSRLMQTLVKRHRTLFELVSKLKALEAIQVKALRSKTSNGKQSHEIGPTGL
ncbi:gamma-aminobutyric acid type B receptor subunit 2-like [Asterias rubens]|uniref:gamma-aminobutyric acid type B receptor subunit 2-like n=1 Tax=Asterias rubens TaxID=7604 RepID=UPI00145535D0|nr:gamma-aminobutyric acid type B receptor subunit 2-like [Asterias rubens]